MSDDDYDPNEDSSVAGAARGSVQRVHVVEGQIQDFFAIPKDQKDAIARLRIKNLNDFRRYFSFTYPGIMMSLFANKIKYEANDYTQLKLSFQTGAETLISYYQTAKGRPHDIRRPECENMDSNITDKDWLLFVGLGRSELVDILQRRTNFSRINFGDIENILRYFDGLTDAQLQMKQNHRRQHRYKLFESNPNDYICEYKDGNGKIWYVRKDIDLPWHIPLYSNFFNSKAVKPEWATTEEMILLGKMYESNSKVYIKESLSNSLHSFFQQMRSMSQKLVPKGNSALSYIDMFSYGREFYFCRPDHDLRILHTNHIGYCLFLFFQRHEIERELDKYWVPFGSTLCEFTGEIRPLDLSVPSRVEMTYYKPKGNYKTSCVVTNKYDDGHRPGMGSCAFFANSTCQFYNDNINFECKESHIWNSKSNVVKDQAFLEKFIVINACKNITGNDIMAWNNQHRPQFVSWFNSECVQDTELIFPVEFVYQTITQKSLKEGNYGNTMCQCLTSCSGKLPIMRGRLDLFDEELIHRKFSDPKEKIAAHKQDPSAMKSANSTHDFFERYLAQFSR